MRNTTRVLLAVTASILAAVSASTPAAGEPPERIIGGEPATEGQFPWAVWLSMGCTGSLVTEQVVLTAAHCVRETGPDTSITAYYGSVDLSDPDLQEIGSSYVHRSATYDEGRGDWALIKLAQPVTDPAVVAMADTTAGDTGPEFTMVGWGPTSPGGPSSGLNHATVRYVDDGSCAQAHGELDPAGELCAAGEDGTGGVCSGDSGGPLLWLDGAEPVVVGIVSWGEGCARPGTLVVSAQLSHWYPDVAAALEELR